MPNALLYRAGVGVGLEPTLPIRARKLLRYVHVPRAWLPTRPKGSTKILDRSPVANHINRVWRSLSAKFIDVAMDQQNEGYKGSACGFSAVQHKKQIELGPAIETRTIVPLHIIRDQMKVS
jgi:hypothetical protein